MLADPKLSPFADDFYAPPVGKLNDVRNGSLVFFPMHDEGVYRGKSWAALRAVSGGGAR